MGQIVPFTSRSSRFAIHEGKSRQFYWVPLSEARSLREWLKDTEFTSGLDLIDSSLADADETGFSQALIACDRWDHYAGLRAVGFTRYEQIA